MRELRDLLYLVDAFPVFKDACVCFAARSRPGCYHEITA